MRVGCYCRVSTREQQTLPLQKDALTQYAKSRGWTIVCMVEEVASGVKDRIQRKIILDAAKRRAIDVVLVWRLDRWGRSTVDLLHTLHELEALSVQFVSVTEGLDLTTPMGRMMAGMLAIFAEFEHELIVERVKAGIADARVRGKPHGRPATARAHSQQVCALAAQGLSQVAIARQLGIARASVQRLLEKSDDLALSDHGSPTVQPV